MFCHIIVCHTDRVWKHLEISWFACCTMFRKFPTLEAWERGHPCQWRWLHIDGIGFVRLERLSQEEAYRSALHTGELLWLSRCWPDANEGLVLEYWWILFCDRARACVKLTNIWHGVGLGMYLTGEVWYNVVIGPRFLARRDRENSIARPQAGAACIPLTPWCPFWTASLLVPGRKSNSCFSVCTCPCFLMFFVFRCFKNFVSNFQYILDDIT